MDITRQDTICNRGNCVRWIEVKLTCLANSHHVLTACRCSPAVVAYSERACMRRQWSRTIVRRPFASHRAEVERNGLTPHTTHATPRHANVDRLLRINRRTTLRTKGLEIMLRWTPQLSEIPKSRGLIRQIARSHVNWGLAPSIIRFYCDSSCSTNSC